MFLIDKGSPHWFGDIFQIKCSCFVQKKNKFLKTKLVYPFQLIKLSPKEKRGAAIVYKCDTQASWEFLVFHQKNASPQYDLVIYTKYLATVNLHPKYKNSTVTIRKPDIWIPDSSENRTKCISGFWLLLSGPVFEWSN